MWTPFLYLCHTPYIGYKIVGAPPGRGKQHAIHDNTIHSGNTCTSYSLVKLRRCLEHDDATVCERYCENSWQVRSPLAPSPSGGEDSPLHS